MKITSKEEQQMICSCGVNEAGQLLEDGVKAMQEDELELALEALGKALQIRVENHGVMAPETAPAYFKYGCALLRKAVQDAGIFCADISEDAMQDAITDDENHRAGGLSAESEHGVMIREEHAAQVDDIGDMGLAWEMLETARVIFSKMSGRSKEMAEVHEKLADVQMEQGQFSNAVQEYRNALGFLADCDTPQARARLGVLFQLSLAFQMQV
mmetsp:Transcript_31996/g.61553  ORF Transcript_31996/g.61553 Transcript_31996/m.61553 type:complete len:213 (+) Transcript_31996:135-773(+)